MMASEDSSSPPEVRWECDQCGGRYNKTAPFGATEGDKYDGKCPICKNHVKMTVVQIIEE